jgi:ABC-type glycerol-3-phosphate transport system substrate-binding protein
MDERTSLSRRKLLHALAGTGVIAAADLAWWDAPYIGPRKAWGAEPVRFQWSVPEPTRIALMNSLVERFNASQKDFAVQMEYVPQAQAREAHRSITGGNPPDLCRSGITGSANSTAWARSKTFPRAQSHGSIMRMWRRRPGKP